MKKYLPLILPVLAAFVLIFLGFRWYKTRLNKPVAPPEISTGQEIENLSASEAATLEKLKKGTGNYQTATMTGSGIGQLRYEYKNNKVYFSVNANLATNNGGTYTLYLKEAGANTFSKASILNENKGGLTASAALNQDKLPILVQVRLGEEVVLSGEIPVKK